MTCLACETSFHIDCWSFNGSRCGVYACQGKRAVAGLPEGTSLPVMNIDADCVVWSRRALPLLLTLVGCAGILASLIGAWMVPSASFILAFTAVTLCRGVFDTLAWLKAVEIDDDGLRLRYLFSRPRKIDWGQVIRGPGRGNWSGALLLPGGEILVLPADEPGFDQVLQRLSLELSRHRLTPEPIFIGERA